MTFSHDDIRARLVDYLYGELRGDARAAFEQHLARCAACGAEVTGAERARVLAREVVRRPLGDEVPDRVRARAFEAARAALAQKGATPRAPAQAAVAATRAPAEGWFRRLRRRWTWTFPTFATVAAMAVFLLVRATVFREAKHPLGEETSRDLSRGAASPPPIAPAAPPSPAAPSRAAPASAGHHQGEGEAAAPTAREKRAPREHRARPHGARALDQDGAGGPPGVSGLLEPGAGLDRLAGSAAPRASGLGGLGREPAPAAEVPSGSAGAPRARAAAKVGRSRGHDVEGERDDEAPEAVRYRAASPAGAAAADEDRQLPEPRAARAAPPPPSAAPAFAAKPAPSAGEAGGEALAAKKRAPDLSPVESRPAQGKGAAPPRPRKAQVSEETAPALAEAPAENRAAPAAPAADPVSALTRRAEAAMKARRWDDAIFVYRDLLRRFPAHPAAPFWRSRLAAAQAALAAETGRFATPPP